MQLPIDAPVGTNLLELAHENKMDLEGACEGSCACSTCHVYIDPPELFDRLEEASIDEEDLLDLAFEPQENSRLACQLNLTSDMEGMIVEIPPESRNIS